MMSYIRYSRQQRRIDVERSCGHVESTWVYNTDDYSLRSEQRKLCHDCYVADCKQQDYDADQSLGLPELEGSQKQIGWAISIRIKYWQKFEQTYQICCEIVDYIDNNFSEDQLAAAKEEDGYKFWKFWKENRLNPSAKFWIDTRGELSQWDLVVDTIEIPPFISNCM